MTVVNVSKAIQMLSKCIVKLYWECAMPETIEWIWDLILHRAVSAPFLRSTCSISYKDSACPLCIRCKLPSLIKAAVLYSACSYTHLTHHTDNYLKDIYKSARWITTIEFGYINLCYRTIITKQNVHLWSNKAQTYIYWVTHTSTIKTINDVTQELHQ